MKITAKLKHLRISPRKVRLVTNLIKGLSVEEAERQLRFLNKRSARPILKLLRSALANAENNAKLSKEGFYVSNVIVDSGPVLKRWRARAMGRAASIMKRTSHITLILGIKEGIVSKKEKPSKEARPEPLKEKVEKEKKSEPRDRTKIYPRAVKSEQKGLGRRTFGRAKKFFRRKSI